MIIIVIINLFHFQFIGLLAQQLGELEFDNSFLFLFSTESLAEWPTTETNNKGQ